MLSRPQIMGILNVTPDSFSDGGLHNEAPDAIAFAHEMLEQGADIIDVGGESTRPGADAVSVSEELSRVLPVVGELADQGVCVSIDTYHPEVAAECLDAGALIINDISGFSDQRMIELAADSGAGVIPMHMAGSPKNMQKDPRYDDAVGEIRSYLLDVAAKLEEAGVSRDRICIDPGPGFGKNVRHNMQLLAGMQQLSTLGYPLIAAFSRKTSLGKVTGVEKASDRILSSVAASVLSYCGGARIFRVHDVAQTVEELKVASNAAFAQFAEEDGGFSTMLPGKRAIVALGSNIGDPVANIVEATAKIDSMPKTRVIRSSSIFRTEPAYYEDQDTFANSVVWVQTELSPDDLLTELFKIEDEFHRVRKIPNGPRTLDLDVLDYQGVVSDDPRLILPHPRILERDFTVTPILELEQFMLDEMEPYVFSENVTEPGNRAEGDASVGGFKLADGKRVVSDGVQYGKILERLLDSDSVI